MDINGSNGNWIHALLKTISAERNVSILNICNALEDALEFALSRFYGPQVDPVVIVDDKTGTLSITLEARSYDLSLSSLSIKQEQLPRWLILQVKKEWPEFIKTYEVDQRYNYWRNFKFSAKEGIIIRASEDSVDVDIGGQIGFMKRDHFTPTDRYIQGQPMWFYILSISRKCTIQISRSSRSLPAALLREKIPWGNFKCNKRMVGVKSYVQSDVYLRKEIIQDISRELGEVVLIHLTKNAQSAA